MSHQHPVQRMRGSYKKNQSYLSHQGEPHQAQQFLHAQAAQQQAAQLQQQQIQQQQAQQQAAPVISFKPTDTMIPKALEDLFPEQVAMYSKLQNKEKQIDLIINRKLVDLQDLQAGINNGSIPDADSDNAESETLRIFVYNISENQPWQQTAGQQLQQQQQQQQQPSFTLRVEGRLLNEESPDSPTRRKFSSFLSSLSVELKNASIPNNIVEWHEDLLAGKSELERHQQHFDGLDIKRFGSSIPSEDSQDTSKEIEVEIAIQPKSYPLVLKIVNEDLAQLIGYEEITQHDCFIKIFNYIKLNNLFELIDDKTKQHEDIKSQHSQQQSIIMVKSDELLYKIFKLERFSITKLLETLSTTLLKPIDPIKITYKINTLVNTTLGDVIIDVNVGKSALGGIALSNKASTINKLIADLVNDTKTSLELQKLQEKISVNLNLLNYNKYKFDFYNKLAAHPSKFLQDILTKNANFLRILSSDNFASVDGDKLDEEVLRKSDFYKDDKINEFVELLLNSGRI